MKKLIYGFAIALFAFTLQSCSRDSEQSIEPTNPVEDMYQVFASTEDHHVLEVYSENKTLEIGYNELAIRIKDKASGRYLTNAQVSWTPIMHMAHMMHSAPASPLENNDDKTVYEGHIVFTMASTTDEYWEIKLSYNVNGQPIEKTFRVEVKAPADGMQTVQSFKGADGHHYVTALVEPEDPEVAVNDMEAVLYKMNDMMHFSPVKNYTIAIDPRMPGMGNHSSPNNVALTFDTDDQKYEGKLSLTMTGYWRINLKVLNENGELLKGEDITDEHPKSSLYFELEF